MASRSITRVLALLVLAGSGGCTDDEGGLLTMAGQTNDEEIYVALVRDDRDMVLYACNGTTDEVSVVEWFQGPHEDGRFALESMRTGSRADGEFYEHTGEGVLYIADDEIPFSYQVAEGDGGLYFDEIVEGDEEHWAGWAVLDDGLGAQPQDRVHRRRRRRDAGRQGHRGRARLRRPAARDAGAVALATPSSSRLANA